MLRFGYMTVDSTKSDYWEYSIILSPYAITIHFYRLCLLIGWGEP
jgi:hypothetical protein